MVWYKFWLRCHDLLTCCGLWKLILSPALICFIFNVWKHHKFHKFFNKGRFSRANRSNDSEINVATSSLRDIFEDIYFSNKIIPLPVK
ncbi:hypothetical protein JCM19047_4332 [Bacillus sp. JCM 19047]|nr:hypothetical protein JCM19047_4332 [Bacillus sp. JCM 19047]